MYASAHAHCPSSKKKEPLHKADQDYIWNKAESHKSQLVTKNSTMAKTVGPSQRPWLSRHFFVTCYLTIPSYSDQPCPHCDFVTPKDTPSAKHIFLHTSHSLERFLEMLKESDMDSDIFSVGTELKRLYHVCNL